MLKTKERIETGRNLNLDLIRCVAVFCVLSIHIFHFVPFYYECFVGKYMWALTFVNISLTVCVPLFSLLTGYLCIHRKVTKEYYKKLLPLLATYVLACVFTLMTGVTQKEYRGLWTVLLDILNTNYGVVGYSWYVAMYLGLFLLIPFLNLTYRGLENKKQKQMLLCVMIILTVIPSALNGRDYSTFAAYFQPGLPKEEYEVFTPYWEALWPITYYFIGAYIREYDIKLPKWKNLLLLIGWLVYITSAVFFRSYGEYHLLTVDILHYGTYDKFVQSVLAFLLLLHLDLTRIPKWIASALTRVSKLSFGIYLCSYATDILVYYNLLKFAETTRQKHMLAPFLMLLSFLLATLASQVIQWIMDAPKLLKRKAT